MTNKMYPKGKEKILSAGVNLIGDTIKIILVDSADYTYQDTHEYLSDVPSAARVATSAALTGKAVTNGVFTASNPTFTAVTGNTAEVIITYKDTGVESTSPIIAYTDNNPGQVTVSANASVAATTISINPATVASTGAYLSLVSGTGPSIILITSPFAVGATSISVSALTSAITSGAVYEYNGLSVTPNGNDIPVLIPPEGLFSI